MPVGMWVMRMAESVTLTCWPPAPLERKVSTRRSFSSISTSTSFGQLRPDVERGERGVAARRLVERRDAHQAMDAGLGQQHAVGEVAVDRQRGALDARLVAGLHVHHFALEAAALGPADVHAQQHLGPVLRLGAAGAGMDGDDGVAAIVLAAEHLLGLAGGRPRRRARRARGRDPRRPAHPPAPIRRARRDRRRAASATRSSRRRLRAGAGAAAASARPPGPSRSRGRPTSASIFVEFVGRAGGVKDSSADRTRAGPGPDIGGAVRRVRK